MYASRRKARRNTDLCSGPGKLAAAFAIDRSHDGLDLATSDTLYVERLCQRALPGRQIVTTTRVGIDDAQEWSNAPLRFYLKANPHVSVR